jgi:hypothetical protein
MAACLRHPLRPRSQEVDSSSREEQVGNLVALCGSGPLSITLPVRVEEAQERDPDKAQVRELKPN